MFKSLVSVLFVFSALTVVCVASLSAQEKPSLAGLQVVSAGGEQTGHSGLEYVGGAERWMPRRIVGAADRSSKDDAGSPRTAKKRDGRKAMWITLAASAAAIALAVRFAPEAQIPATPSRSFTCTSFYRPGTLQTVSGYTCWSR
jgi:hypothetical protein